MLRPTVSQPVHLGIKHPSGAHDQIFITVRQLRVCWCRVLSLTRRRLSFIIGVFLANLVILGSESRGTRDHILLSQIRDFSSRRLLQLAGLRWRYSTPPLYGVVYSSSQSQGNIATDSQSVRKSWCRALSGARDHIFIIVWQLQPCFCGTPSLTRGRVYLLYMLLAFASAVFLESGSLGTRDLILLPHI
jgi:hypothetical protein